MPALFEYLLKANIALLLFCAGYYLVLRRLTFYSLNRVYLICAILFSALYPLVDLSAFVQQHQAFVQPVEAVQVIIVNWQAPVQQAVAHKAPAVNWWNIARIIFFAGIGCMLIRLIVQMAALYRLTRKAREGNLYNYKIKAVQQDINPFSFWQSIYINPDNHEPEQLKAILAHEQVHITGWHTLDILLAEISLIVYWFNPGVWLIKRAIAENIEFITDRKILNQGIDSKTYQYSLLHVALTAGSPAIVNHFNISKLKKRIIMMNSENSSRYNLTRYTFIIPLVGGLLCFTFSKANVAVKTKSAIKHMAASVIHEVKSNIKIIGAEQDQPTDTLAALSTPMNNELKAESLHAIIQSDTTKNITLTPLPALTITNDTIKPSRHLNISINGGNSDSTVYIINGKAGRLKDISAIHPDNIAEMNVISHNSLPPALSAYTNTKGVVIVTTKDSPEGLKYRNSILPNQPIYHSNGSTLRRFFSTQQTFTYNNTTPDTIKINANGQASVNLSNKFGNHDNIVVMGSGDKGGKNRVIIQGTDFSTFTNPQHMLLMVDGHEVSNSILQSLSPNHIGSIAVLNAAQGTKRYGAKAKNGVLIISTRTPENTGFNSTINHINVTGFNTINKQMPATAYGWGNTVPATGGYKFKFNTTTTTANQALVVIDGQPSTYPTLKLINPQEIENVVILKDASATALYGDKAKNGVISVTTKNSNSQFSLIDPNNNLVITSREGKTDSLVNGKKTLIYRTNTVQKKLDKQYIIIDDKPATVADYKKINPGNIAQVITLADTAATALFGHKGKNGVIIITTKKP